MKTFAYVGSWRAGTKKAMNNNGATGVHVFEYNSGVLTHKADYLPGCWVGCMLPTENNKLYVTDEQMNSSPNTFGGGGYVYSLEAEADGTLETLGKTLSYGVYPCFMALSLDKKYAVVPNHSTARACITKTIFENGEYKVITERDEPNVALFEVNADCSLGKVLDIVKLEHIGGKAYPRSTPHCVFRFPNIDVFAVIDNGADVIHRFTIDRENNKLCLSGSKEMDARSAPRYAAIHPTHPYIYLVDESRTQVHTLSYNTVSGELDLLEDVELVPDGLELCTETIFPVSADPADIIIDSKGEYVYATCRGVNMISVFKVGEDHKLTRVQVVSCGGRNPRSISLTPEGDRLFCCNLESDSVVCFNVNSENGQLTYENETEVLAPGFVRFMTF